MLCLMLHQLFRLDMTCSSSPGPATSDGQHLIHEAFQLQSLDHLSVQTRTLGSIRRHQWQQLQGIRKVKSSVLLSTRKGVTQEMSDISTKQWNMCFTCETKIGSYLVKIRDYFFSSINHPSRYESNWDTISILELDDWQLSILYAVPAKQKTTSAEGPKCVAFGSGHPFCLGIPKKRRPWWSGEPNTLILHSTISIHIQASFRLDEPTITSTCIPSK